jgi:histidinol dehydrogenase
MTAVPAMVAGVKQIAVVSPPRYNGSIHPAILAVCCELGITEVYRVGGIQAVTALAYGTASIPKVDKIAGPGNWYVTLAKREVYGIVDIDSIAGPSEVLIIANSQANPAWAAADMLSQAEHSPGSAICVTDSMDFAKQVVSELEQQVQKLSRCDSTLKCLESSSAVIVYPNISDAVDFANEFAAEHLQIQCGTDTHSIAASIRNAGAIFIGDYSPVALGDYFAGPSHTLPSGRSARFFSALSSNDFIKATSIIEYDRDRLSAAAQDIIRLAETEGLDAHAKSVSIRFSRQ